ENQLRTVRSALTQISNVRRLSPSEEQELNDIIDFLENPDAPPTDLTIRQLQSALENSSLVDTDNLASDATKKASLINTMKAYRDADNQALDLT
ncbi:7014_t:CDS:2, partial [Paraglomus occultum]